MFEWVRHPVKRFKQTLHEDADAPIDILHEVFLAITMSKRSSCVTPEFTVMESKIESTKQKHPMTFAEGSENHELLRRTFTKTPESREAWEIDLLYDYVMRNGNTNKLFQGAQAIVCKTICREMTLLEMQRDAIVCQQGDYGDAFYIIFSGSVSVYIQTQQKKYYPFSGDDRPTSDREECFANTNELDGEFDKDYSTDRLQHGIHITEINSGGTFGEVAVMDPTAKRSSTVICNTTSSFICLKRGAYQRLLRITNSTELTFTETEFLKTSYIFKTWPHSELVSLSRRLHRTSYPVGSHLVRAGTDARMIYFIYAGCVQESVQIVYHFDNDGTVRKCLTLEEHKKTSLQNRARNPDLQSKESQTVRLELNLYQEHDICGEQSIRHGQKTHTTDLIANSPVKALVLDRETWKTLFSSYGYPHIRKAYHDFRSLANIREDCRLTRVKLAIANPKLILTLSARDMVKDGLGICGWCGSQEHMTGSSLCVIMKQAKRKQATNAQHIENEQKKYLFVDTDDVDQNSVQINFEKGARFVKNCMHISGGATKKMESDGEASENEIVDAAGSSGEGTKAVLPLQPLAPPTLSTGFHPSSNRASLRHIRIGKNVSDSQATIKTYKAIVPVNSDMSMAAYRLQMIQKVKGIKSLEEYRFMRSQIINDVNNSPKESKDSLLRPLTLKPQIPKQTRSKKTNRSRGSLFESRISRMLRKVRGKSEEKPIIEEGLCDFRSVSTS